MKLVEYQREDHSFAPIRLPNNEFLARHCLHESEGATLKRLLAGVGTLAACQFAVCTNKKGRAAARPLRIFLKI
jgi:hypothetical protein